jgi:sucrose-phosphate synthase
MDEHNNGLYIALLSIHGLIRGHNLELGRDADTGGQTLYVLELAEALSRHPQVARVDVVTRLLEDSALDADYAQPLEIVSDKFRIVRIPAGPPGYLPKEQLWECLDVFADNLSDFYRQQARWPDILHSHYADAGYVGEHLANQFAIPLIHTGHSLGRVKQSRLLASGLSAQQIEQQYNMSHRIEAEERTLATAQRVITSTRQEIEEQYSLYDHYQPEQMRVVPPGTDLSQFHPPTGGELEDPLFIELTRHLQEAHKPMILALSRPDRRKNIINLVEAYGRSKALQTRANLVIIAGNREDIDALHEGAQAVFHELLVAMDRYELYGKMSLPKHHRRDQVPMIYRIAAASGGVFVNPALTEPFGLTLIEAAASGLPLVATEDGGPSDILANCQNGLLIDPLDPESIGHALWSLLSDPIKSRRYIENGLQGVRTHYAWQAHVDRYLQLILPIARDGERLQRMPLQRRTALYRDRALVACLDANLMGNVAALHKLMTRVREHRKSTLFMVVTERRLDSALQILKHYRMPDPDILIASSGTEIYYAPQLTSDSLWHRHIDYLWAPERLREILDEVPGLRRRPKFEQSRFQLRYSLDPSQVRVESVKSLLHQQEQSVHVQAGSQSLDILPLRASKGTALRYVADRLQIPLERVFVAGGSGADEDMLRGNTLAVVTHDGQVQAQSGPEEASGIYFARHPFAVGILEALEHYGFWEGVQNDQAWSNAVDVSSQAASGGE